MVRGDPEDVRGAAHLFGLLPHRVERGFARGVLEAHDAVLDPRGPEDLDQGDIARPGDMGASARLRVPLRDLHDTQFAARDRATLVQPEPELSFREVAGQDLRTHLPSRENLVVREFLDLAELRIGQGVVVRDVEPREVGRLVRAGLPHMIPQGLPRRPEDDVGRGVVPHQRFSARGVDRAGDPLPPQPPGVAADEVQDSRPDPLHVVHFELVQGSVIRLLAAAFRIEERLVQRDGLAFHREDFRAERPPPAVLVHAELRRREVL